MSKKRERGKYMYVWKEKRQVGRKVKEKCHMAPKAPILVCLDLRPLFEEFKCEGGTNVGKSL